MKGFKFVDARHPEHNKAAFWINENGTISQKLIPSWIGCLVTDEENNPQLLAEMILSTRFKPGSVTAEYLNSIG